MLEIAPGYGRITQFLHPRCDRLTVVDLNETCISACRQRFARRPHITYNVNDGRSLAAAEDSAVDFALSFDSLVHADAHVIEGYLKQLATKLTADGVAVLHHSNAGAYRAAQDGGPSRSRRSPCGGRMPSRQPLLAGRGMRRPGSRRSLSDLGSGAAVKR